MERFGDISALQQGDPVAGIAAPDPPSVNYEAAESSSLGLSASFIADIEELLILSGDIAIVQQPAPPPPRRLPVVQAALVVFAVTFSGLCATAAVFLTANDSDPTVTASINPPAGGESARPHDRFSAFMSNFHASDTDLITSVWPSLDKLVVAMEADEHETINNPDLIETKPSTASTPAAIVTSTPVAIPVVAPPVASLVVTTPVATPAIAPVAIAPAPIASSPIASSPISLPPNALPAVASPQVASPAITPFPNATSPIVRTPTMTSPIVEAPIFGIANIIVSHAVISNAVISNAVMSDSAVTKQLRPSIDAAEPNPEGVVAMRQSPAAKRRIRRAPQSLAPEPSQAFARPRSFFEGLFGVTFPPGLFLPGENAGLQG